MIFCDFIEIYPPKNFILLCATLYGDFSSFNVIFGTYKSIRSNILILEDILKIVVVFCE